MTRRQALARVERWRAQMVPEWRITLMDQPPPGERGATLACIESDEHYHHARLWLEPQALRRPVGEVDVTIVHELLHLLMREMRRVIDLADGQVHRDVHDLLAQHFNAAEEQAVERLARLIALVEHPHGLQFGTAEL